MSTLLLHHFDASPFAEKIRLVMGLKKLAWRSVQIPMVMPKPDLTALTGGYRKTPVLQIGAEIHCDTRHIARVLEAHRPEPSLFPDGGAGLPLALSHWSDGAFFMPGAALAMAENDQIPPEVIEDRKAFFGFTDFEALRADRAHLYGQVLANAALIEEQLADGRPFLLGEAPGWADITACFVVWMLRANVAPAERYLRALARMAQWEARVRAFGHGERTETSAQEALAVARDAAPAPGDGVDAADPLGFAAGDEVVVEPADYGVVPVRGALITLDRHRITVRRTDPRVGEVNVHFPRAGYRVRRP